MYLPVNHTETTDYSADSGISENDWMVIITIIRERVKIPPYVDRNMPVPTKMCLNIYQSVERYGRGLKTSSYDRSDPLYS